MDLQEWTPLVDLVGKIPTRVQRSLLFQDVLITCLDLVDEFIALGTNVGIVYWYNRKTTAIERLQVDGSGYLTRVRIISTVDFMVAAGCRQGSVNIFQIPKEAPPDVSAELLLKNKPIERYTLCEIHRAAITDFAWSKNGMKLFSGDALGMVAFTEINYQSRTWESREIVNEKYEVVQLSLRKAYLLLSTTYRTVICTQEDKNKWRVIQVGKKDRKMLSPFGATFHVYQKQPQLVCTRSGFRLWIANSDGEVAQTLLFKEIIKGTAQEIPILNPSRHPVRIPTTFGTLHTFQDKYLLSVANDMLFVLDLDAMKVIASLTRLRKIIDISVNKHEILILESGRSLVRISTLPDSSQTTILYRNAELFAAVDRDSQIVVADECLEESQPDTASGGSRYEEIDSVDIEQPVEQRPTNSNASSLQMVAHMKKLAIFDSLNEANYDESILYKSERTKSKHSAKTNTMVEIGQIAKDCEETDDPPSESK
ncbi:WD repeat-containing protein CG11141 [Sabethes cyaneus]|uniref:WD repeat-containing protein CG11141 n=1 Tax=Sabethes cyaneus TaxID=53552 RepID=UPI00237D9E70|nr:WD repeat-containing protein CG11141 [Sabethes cyaneus]